MSENIMAKEKIANPCAFCEFLSALVLRHNLKPLCKFNVFKFKERIRIDYQKDKDINEKTCKRFVHYEQKINKTE